MKVVVTGGAGFIGANLCRALLEHGHIDEVVAYDDLSTGRRTNLDGLAVELIEGDLCDAERLGIAVRGADSVVHLGARGSVPRSMLDPLASHHANATGTLTVLESMREHDVEHVIVASSSSVYGANPVLPKHEGLKPSPVSPYAVTKLATEAYALAYGCSFGLRTLAFRFFNVFGPLQPADHAYAAVVPRFIDAALSGTPLPVHGDGTQTRDFTFVDSITPVLIDAVLRRVTAPEPVNLAFGSRSSLLEIIDALEAIIGRPLARDHQPSRPGDVHDSMADTSVLRSLFPDAQGVTLREGLERTVAWFRSSEGSG